MARKPTNIPTEEIYGKYINGELQKDLASEYGVSPTTIRSRIKEYKASGRIYLPIEEIFEKYMDREPLKSLASEYGVSVNTILNRIKEYKESSNEKFVRKRRPIKGELEQVIQEYNNEMNEKKAGNQFDLTMIYNYFRLGFNLDQIQAQAERMGYFIKEEDIKKIQKVITGELKVASETSIYNMLKSGYTYLQIMNEAKKQGYLILPDKYQSALNCIRNEDRKENKKGEGRDD